MCAVCDVNFCVKSVNVLSIFYISFYCTTSLITEYKYTYVTINWLVVNASSDSSIKLNHN